MNPVLMRIVLNTFIRLEESTEDEVDPDFAVHATDDIGYELQQLSKEERHEFLAFARAEAERTGEHVELLKNLGEMLNLTEETAAEAA